MSSKQTGKAPAPPVSVDDDDFDDLDDVLTQFSKPPPPQPSKPAAAATASKKPFGPEPPPNMPELDDDEFAAEFARGMEAMMKELVSGGVGTEGKPDPQEKEMREAFEKMLVEDLETGPNAFGDSFPEFKPTEKAAGTSREAGPSTASTSTGQAEDPFQKSIREAMERLKNSENSSKADAANSNDPLQALLSQLGGMGDMGDMGDLGDTEDVQGLLENMMSQLLSKDLLYEPLKELDEKFPGYFKENESKLSKEDLEKYKRQQTLISQTVKVLESPDYSDSNPEKAGEVMKLMTEMQTLGSPPQEIMGELPPGFALGEDGLPGMGPDGCLIA